MLTGVRNPELYQEWLDWIDCQQTKQAFQYLVGVLATLQSFECHIQHKGEVRDFRIHDESGNQRFSFITNKHWLLFYFRLPATQSGQYEAGRLHASFDSFSENASGEWTVKLRSIHDVQRLQGFLEWGEEI